MKTAMLKKKLAKLFDRAPEADKKLALAILELPTDKTHTFYAAVKEAERPVLDQLWLGLETFAGPAKTQALSDEIRAEQWWDNHLAAYIEQYGHTAWVDLVTQLTRSSNIGYDQGQIRPDRRLGQWDVYYTLYPAGGWNATAGALSGLTKAQVEVQELMQALGVKNLEQLHAVQKLQKVLDGLTPGLADRAILAMQNPLLFRIFLSTLPLDQMVALLGVFDAARKAEVALA